MPAPSGFKWAIALRLAWLPALLRPPPPARSFAAPHEPCWRFGKFIPPVDALEVPPHKNKRRSQP